MSISKIGTMIQANPSRLQTLIVQGIENRVTAHCDRQSKCAKVNRNGEKELAYSVHHIDNFLLKKEKHIADMSGLKSAIHAKIEKANKKAFANSPKEEA